MSVDPTILLGSWITSWPLSVNVGSAAESARPERAIARGCHDNVGLRLQRWSRAAFVVRDG